MTDALASTDSQATGEEIEESGSTDALPVDRLEALSDAAFGAGSIERAIELREQAYRRTEDATSEAPCSWTGSAVMSAGPVPWPRCVLPDPG